METTTSKQTNVSVPLCPLKQNEAAQEPSWGEAGGLLLSVKARLRGGLSGVGKGWVRLNQSKAGAAVGEEVRGLGGEGVALVITLR